MAARSTRLYQRAQSPLIQGQSKRERPWWQPVLVAFFASLGSLFGVWWLLAVFQGVPPAEAVVVLFADAVAILIRTVPGALIGSVAGVSVARGWGSRRPWIAGTVLGCVLAGAGLFFLL